MKPVMRGDEVGLRGGLLNTAFTKAVLVSEVVTGRQSKSLLSLTGVPRLVMTGIFFQPLENVTPLCTIVRRASWKLT